MRVPLERHQLLDLLGAVAHHPADVVAGEVDEHDVLRPFLRVLDELGFEPAIVLVVASPPARPGDRAADDPPVAQLHQRLGRRTDDRRLGMVQVVHVRRRVDEPQHAVDVERRHRLDEIEALREHDLEDVAFEDVLLRRVHRRGPRARGEVAADLRQLVEHVAGRDRRARTAMVCRDRRPRSRAGRSRRRTSRRPSPRRHPAAGRRSRSGTAAGGNGRTRRRCPASEHTASGNPRSSGGGDGRCSISRTVS